MQAFAVSVTPLKEASIFLGVFVRKNIDLPLLD